MVFTDITILYVDLVVISRLDCELASLLVYIMYISYSIRSIRTGNAKAGKCIQSDTATNPILSFQFIPIKLRLFSAFQLVTATTVPIRGAPYWPPGIRIMRLVGGVLVHSGDCNPARLLCAILAHDSDFDVPANVMVTWCRGAAAAVAPGFNVVHLDVLNDPFLTLAKREVGDWVRSRRPPSTPVTTYN